MSAAAPAARQPTRSAACGPTPRPCARRSAAAASTRRSPCIGPAPTRPAQREAGDAGLRLIETGLPLDWIATDRRASRRAGRELAGSRADAKAPTSSSSTAPRSLAGCELRPALHRGPAQLRRDLVGGGQGHAAAARFRAGARDLVAARAATRRRPRRAEPRLRGRRPRATYDARRADRCRSTTAAPRARPATRPQGDFVFTAGRLWDEGKNVATLDRAAARLRRPFLAAGPSRARTAQASRSSICQRSASSATARLARPAAPRGRSSPRRRSTSRSAWRCSKPRRPAARWCSRTSRPSASSGTARRSSSIRATTAAFAARHRRPARPIRPSATQLGRAARERARGATRPSAWRAAWPRSTRASLGRTAAGRHRRRGMKIVYFTHSLRSCWNHGNAHFLRGVLQRADRARARRARSSSREGAGASRTC